MIKVFKIYDPEYLGDDYKEFKGFDHEDVAIEYAEFLETDGDYCIASGNKREIKVEDNKGIVKRFRLTAEQTVNYYAHEIE